MKKIIHSILIILISIVIRAADKNIILDPEFGKLSKKTAVGSWKLWAQKGCKVEHSDGKVTLTNEIKNKVSTVSQEVRNLKPGNEYIFETEAKSSMPRAWGKVIIQIDNNGKKTPIAETKPLMAQTFSNVQLKFKLPAEVSSVHITLFRSTWWGALGAISFRRPVLKMVSAKKNSSVTIVKSVSSIQPENYGFADCGKAWFCDWGYGMNNVEFTSHGGRLSVARFKFSGVNWLFLMPVPAVNKVFKFKSDAKYTVSFLAQWESGDNIIRLGFRKCSVTGKRILASGGGKRLLKPVFSVRIPKDGRWYAVELPITSSEFEENKEYLLPAIGFARNDNATVIAVDNFKVMRQKLNTKAAHCSVKLFLPSLKHKSPIIKKLAREINAAEQLIRNLEQEIKLAAEKNYDVGGPRSILAVINHAGIRSKDLKLYLNSDELTPDVIIALEKKLRYICDASKRGIAEIKQIYALNKLCNGVVKNQSLRIQNGYFCKNGKPVLLIGPQGDHLEIEEDLDFISKLGCNLVMAESGPVNSVIAGYEQRLKKFMDSAQQHNLSVTFQLAGHFFPLDVISKFPSSRRKEYNNMYWGFFMMSSSQKLCVEHPEVRKILKDFYLKTAKTLSGHPALNSYTIWNEPYYMCYCDASIDGFRKFLKRKYELIIHLNQAWKSDLKSFNNANPPKLIKENGAYKIVPCNKAAWYDWLCFNNYRMTEFFAWIKNIIREVDPFTPIHIKKAAWYFTAYGPIGGIDCEELSNKVEDAVGFDDSYCYNPDGEWLTDQLKAALSVDFMRSVSNGKPLIDSEFHALSEKRADGSRPPKTPGFMRTALLENFIHGLSQLSYFVWRKTNYYHNLNDLKATPYETLEEFGRTCRVLQQYAPLISKFRNSPKKAAILYSNITFLNTPIQLLQSGFWETLHLAAIKKTAESFYALNLPVQFITEKQLKQGLADKFKLIVVPTVTFTDEATFKALFEFVHNGGNLIVTSGSFVGNQYTRPVTWLDKFGIEVIKRNLPAYYVDHSKSSEIGDLIATSVKTTRGKLEKKEIKFISARIKSQKTLISSDGFEIIKGGVSLALFADKSPAIVGNEIGKGRIFYIAPGLETKDLAWVLDILLDKMNLQPEIRVRTPDGGIPWGVELQSAEDGNARIVYMVNFKRNPVKVKLILPGPHSEIYDLLNKRPCSEFINLQPLEPIFLKVNFQ